MRLTKDYPAYLHTLATVLVVIVSSAAGNFLHAGEKVPPSPAVRLAVLGDSDSHSYGDTIWFPEDSGLRGGPNRGLTLQWTEVLARLRDKQIDQGQWGSWGIWQPPAKLFSLVGAEIRTPRKQDYKYNFAWSGAKCRNLLEGTTGQTPHLLRVLAREPQAWQDGIVQIRIGINNLGTREFLDKAASERLGDEVVNRVGACTDAHAAAVETIRRQHPRLRIVLVGVLNNSDWPPFFAHWQSPAAQANINAALDLFDNGLRELAEADENVQFFDDRAWFRGYWGDRSAGGKPDYREVEISDGVIVKNTQGNGPEHAIIADGHGGTLQNAIWARDFIDFLNSRWATAITPIGDDELAVLSEGEWTVEPN